MAQIRRCAHPGCLVVIDRPHIVCTHHWRGLDTRQRAAIQTRLNAWRNEGAAREFYASTIKATA